MARFKKRVIETGIHHTPDGVQEVSPARLRHWHESIKAIIATGVKPPLSWGHLKSAVPYPDDHAYWQSRYQAGRVVGSELSPDGSAWTLEMDAPGVEIDAEGRLVTEATLPDGVKVKAAIDEVSVGAMDWTDGKGHVWNDAPVHLAMTPLPVWVPPGGQPPFEASELIGGAAKAARFGTSTLLARFTTMADEEKDPQKKDDNKPGGGMNIKGIVEALREVGLTIPDEVTDDEGLIIAIKAGGAKKDGDALPPPKKEDATPQEAGAFLSTIRDPLTRQLMADKVKADGEGRSRRIAALEARGLPAHKAKELRAESTTVRFGLDVSGKLLKHPLDDKLDLLEAALPQASFERTFLSTVAGSPADPPEEEQGVREQSRLAAIADRLAARNGLAARGK